MSVLRPEVINDMATRKLTNKDKVLIDSYLIDFDVVKSALTAGYSATVAHTKAYQWVSNSKLNPKPHVYEEIQRRLKKIEEKSDLSQQWVLDRLEEITDRCLQRIPVMYFDKEKKEYVQEKDADGEGVWTFQAQGANKALESIGRHLGMFNDKLTLDGTVNSVVTIFELPDNGRSDATDTTEDNQATTG